MWISDSKSRFKKLEKKTQNWCSFITNINLIKCFATKYTTFFYCLRSIFPAAALKPFYLNWSHRWRSFVLLLSLNLHGTLCSYNIWKLQPIDAWKLNFCKLYVKIPATAGKQNLRDFGKTVITENIWSNRKHSEIMKE